MNDSPAADSDSLPLSIIIPVLNEAEEIYPCLRRLQALRKQGVQVIVVDGGSDDDTIAVATPLADQVISCDKGRARQMNAGAALADRQWLLFLHADTRLPVNLPDIMVVFNFTSSVWGFFGVKVRGAPALLRVVQWFMNKRSFLTSISTGDQCQFVKRAVFEQIDGFADIPLMEDIELSKRLKRQSRPLFVSAKAETSGRKWQRDGIWPTIFLMWRLRLAYFFGVSPTLLEQRYYPPEKP
ncbi:MAG: TIGR04283 family arsenosugar biosynthesis glycosyltransferase [Gammaproteobacteria bacterium]|nr:TIGR04283 family arsenosugar biosynthesis glycosyltransferase [Gammaproteobacteria bacterium]MBQ0838998.1 TIGR04283 family arsenosugar biosynthesis glycosyltransferase [Gammaproteobacteria bacterium]